MKSRQYLSFLIVEILVIFAVGGIFQLIANRLYAGMVAGSIFVSLGVWIVLGGVRSSKKGWSLFVGLVHLFLIAIPMLSIRLLNASAEFQDVKIWGLPGPVFHKLSTWVYMVLIVATLADFVQAKRREKTPISQNQSGIE